MKNLPTQWPEAIRSAVMSAAGQPSRQPALMPQQPGQSVTYRPGSNLYIARQPKLVRSQWIIFDRGFRFADGRPGRADGGKREWAW
jgi:hypothetical protein